MNKLVPVVSKECAIEYFKKYCSSVHIEFMPDRKQSCTVNGITVHLKCLYFYFNALTMSCIIMKTFSHCCIVR